MDAEEKKIQDSLAMGYEQLNGRKETAFHLVPLPRNVEPFHGSVRLSGRIRVGSQELRRAAFLLAAELKHYLELDFSVSGEEEPPRAGDIILNQDSMVRGYLLLIRNDQVLIRGAAYSDVCHATSTLLQLFPGRGMELPCVRIEDQADTSYRGVMVDLGRRPHTVNTLKNLILLCKFYKLNYLHLHLSDSELYSFASERYPQLVTPGALSKHDFMLLESFAEQCGVTLLPELDIPGHSHFFLRELPELRCDPPHENTICVSRPESYDVIAALLEELCGVFVSSPYLHIGADEAEAGGWKKCRFCCAKMKRQHWTDEQELYRDFIVRVNEIVKANRKRTIVWEGFGAEGQVKIPRDVIVMEFESYYHHPQHLVDAGYDVINASWQPLYLEGCEIHWPICHIFNWHKYRWENWYEKSIAHPNGLEVAPTPRVLGATLCSWGVPDDCEVKLLHLRMSALAERLWNPESRDFRQYAARLETMRERVESRYLSIPLMK